MVVLVSKYLLIIQEVRKLGPELLTRSLVSKVPHSGARGCLRPAPHWGEGPGALYWLSLRTLERENIPVKPVELWPAPSMGLATLTPVTRKEEPYRVTLPKVPLTGKTGKLSVGSQCEASGEPQSSHRERPAGAGALQYASYFLSPPIAGWGRGKAECGTLSRALTVCDL